MSDRERRIRPIEYVAAWRSSSSSSWWWWPVFNSIKRCEVKGLYLQHTRTGRSEVGMYTHMPRDGRGSTNNSSKCKAQLSSSFPAAATQTPCACSHIMSLFSFLFFSLLRHRYACAEYFKERECEFFANDIVDQIRSSSGSSNDEAARREGGRGD